MQIRVLFARDNTSENRTNYHVWQTWHRHRRKPKYMYIYYNLWANEFSSTAKYTTPSQCSKPKKKMQIKKKTITLWLENWYAATRIPAGELQLILMFSEMHFFPPMHNIHTVYKLEWKGKKRKNYNKCTRKWFVINQRVEARFSPQHRRRYQAEIGSNWICASRWTCCPVCSSLMKEAAAEVSTVVPFHQIND